MIISLIALGAFCGYLLGFTVSARQYILRQWEPFPGQMDWELDDTTRAGFCGYGLVWPFSLACWAAYSAWHMLVWVIAGDLK